MQGILLALEHDADQAKQPITIPAAEAYDLSEQPISAGDMVMFARGRQQIIEAAVTHYAYKVLKVAKLDEKPKNPNYRTSTYDNSSFRNYRTCHVRLEGYEHQKLRAMDLAPAIEMLPLHAALHLKLSPDIIKILVEANPDAASQKIKSRFLGRELVSADAHKASEAWQNDEVLPIFAAVQLSCGPEVVQTLLEAHRVNFAECSAAEIELLAVWCRIWATRSRGLQGKFTADLLKNVTRRVDSVATGFRRDHSEYDDYKSHKRTDEEGKTVHYFPKQRTLPTRTLPTRF